MGSAPSNRCVCSCFYCKKWHLTDCHTGCCGCGFSPIQQVYVFLFLMDQKLPDRLSHKCVMNIFFSPAQQMCVFLFLMDQRLSDRPSHSVLRIFFQPYSTDVCVPISHLPEVILKAKEMIKKAGLIGKLLRNCVCVCVCVNVRVCVCV